MNATLRSTVLLTLVLAAGCSDGTPAPTVTVAAVHGVGPSNAITPGSGTWTQLAPMPTARFLAAGAVLGGKVYAIGGVTFSVSAAVERYDPATNTWSARAPLPNGRYSAAAAAADGKIFVFGGYNTNYDLVTTVYIYNGSTWTTGASMPRQRQNADALAVDGKIYVIGGSNYDGPTYEVDVYDVATDSWTTTASPSPNLEQPRSAVIGRKIIAADPHGLFKYDIDSDSWVTFGYPPTGPNLVNAGASNGFFYAFKTVANQQPAFGYSPGTNQWVTLATAPLSAWTYLSGNVSFDGRIYSLGGRDDASFPINAVWAFAPADARNHPPTAFANGPYRVAEGGEVNFTSTTTDPDGDGLTYFWELGEGATSGAASPSYTYWNDGEYPVTLTVSDGDRVVVAQTRVIVWNVRPTLTGIPGGSITVSTNYQAVGTISDPGTDDVLSATVDWGDGSEPETPAVVAHQITLNHPYSTPGTYNLVVTVSDGDGGSHTVSRWVRVRP